MKYYDIINKFFFRHFDSLHSEKYLDYERNYKVKVSKRATELLPKGTFEELISQKDYSKLMSLLKSIFTATHLVNWRDYDFLRSLPSPEEETLCRGLYDLVFGSQEDLKANVDSLVGLISKQKGVSPGNVWNFLTLLLTAYHPKKYIFIKPNIWDKACKVFGIKNPRTTRMSGSSYLSILAICEEIEEELAGTDLNPADKIDLQTLLYITSGAYDDAIRYWVFKIDKLDLWPLCLKQNVAAMQYEYGKENTSAVTKAHKAVEQIKEGHMVVAALRGKDSFLGYGRVNQEYFVEEDTERLFEKEYGQRIGVEKWERALEKPLVIPGFEDKYAKDKAPYAVAFEISEEAFQIIRGKLEEKTMEKIEYRIKDILEKGYSRNIIIEGPPGTGKTYSAFKTVELFFGQDWRNLQFHHLADYAAGAWDIVQFHPNYSFEDFVRGLVAEPVNNGVAFTARDKIFGQMCRAAEDNSKAPFFLIIYEINRGDLSKILGELIYGLEYRGEPVSLLYVTQGPHGRPSSRLMIPPNLYLMGTMNTADRSIALVDYAIRRRFSFLRLDPDRKVIEEYPGFKDENVRREALSRFDKVQQLFTETSYDYRVGHTYFLAGNSGGKPGTMEELHFKYHYQVVPLLKEYVNEGILDNDAVKELLKDE